MAAQFVQVAGEEDIIVGGPKNFWTWSKARGWDLTHPPSPKEQISSRPITFECDLSDVTIDPSKSALIIIDMSNFSLSDALWTVSQPMRDAESALMNNAIPAARRAGIQIVWLNWGLSEEDLERMPPSSLRVFGFDRVSAVLDARGETPRRFGVGCDIGDLRTHDGARVSAGRALMRGSWSAAIHEPLAISFRQSQHTSKPDVLIYKNRNSGLWHDEADCNMFLQNNGLRTLLFAGMNVDQCVISTLIDAQARGYDPILLRDGCATDSPDFAQWGVEYNCQKNLGFITDSQAFARGCR
ncbi:isochorismatase family protein [Elsinoe ampelina]|uniref:Isochorismatase family protein n=1 Tax=Elsinoe ampelina TaxID=302913 RepID=A0A6A6GR28_9PEZI|nr:isochorismatase family protein [Elsinoe ampelina]